MRAASSVVLTAALTVGLTAAGLPGLTPTARAATSAAALGASTSPSVVPGVDVSQWQRPYGAAIGWASVRSSGRRFALVRATYGTSADPSFVSSWVGARSAGIYRGAYHYAEPSAVAGSAAAQARFFVAKAGRHQGPGDLPPVLDLETTGGLAPARLVTWTSTWLATVRSLSGRVPMIYTNPSFWRQKMANSTAFTGYPLWVANWGVSQPSLPGSWPRWTVWQRSATGRVPGISGDVDLDVFNGAIGDLWAFAHPASVPSIAASASAMYRLEGPVRLSGQLRALGGPVVKDAVVALYRRSTPTGPWTWVARTRTTTVSGYYRFDIAPWSTGTYQVRYGGGTGFAASASALRTVVVRPARVVTHPSLVTSAGLVAQGGAVRLSGHLTTLSGTPVRSRQVSVYRQPSGSTAWRLAGTATTSSGSAYFALPVRTWSTSAYKVVFWGTSTLRPSASYVRTVAVR